jgi:hypothetical protein
LQIEKKNKNYKNHILIERLKATWQDLGATRIFENTHTIALCYLPNPRGAIQRCCYDQIIRNAPLHVHYARLMALEFVNSRRRTRYHLVNHQTTICRARRQQTTIIIRKSNSSHLKLINQILKKSYSILTLPTATKKNSSNFFFVPAPLWLLKIWWTPANAYVSSTVLVFSLFNEFVDGLVVVVMLVKLSLDEYKNDEVVWCLGLRAAAILLLLSPYSRLLSFHSLFNEVESMLGAFDCVLDALFELFKLLLIYIDYFL